MKIQDFELALINNRLREIYGQSLEGLSNFRVIWADDQFEKRRMTHTDSGIQLLTPEVREVPKYRQWVQGKYILERLTVVPEFVETDLINTISYEPLWVFEDKNGNPLNPKWGAIQFVMETVMDNMLHGGYKKYKEPTTEEAIEQKQQRVRQLEEELFGNESPVGTALAHKEAVTVPNKEFRNES